ncbi:hypothetical protein E4633_06520 [Geomonas terrae]|uniref:Uncharacterized protein n=1 Tax=Geomonas terrae TaxID=2562681 RepID=A0A4S1CN87_9BACT|nr:hypothetical protein E4633_06520 [Geomonas terrae]
MTLTKLHHIKSELSRLYREARRGDIDPSDATKFVYILQALARLITDSELEARIERLEQEALNEKTRL